MKNRRIKVAIICDTSGKDDEGMKKVARNLAASIGEIEGFDVSMISTRASLKRATGFDIYHFIGGPTIKTILIAFYGRCANRALKTILTFTNPFLGKTSLFFMSFLKPSICIVSSRKWQEILEKREIPWRMLNVSGVDVERFSAVDKDKKTRLREKLEWPAGKSVALHVGHLKKDRNIEQLLDLQHDPRVQVVIVGSTTTKQSTDLVESLENAGCIVITDYICNIEEYYQAADCFVFPTVDERAAIQIPLSILEALAVSLPVVTTEFGGLKDIFEQHEYAFRYIEQSDFDNLAEIILLHIKKGFHHDAPIGIIDWRAISTNLASLYEE